MRPAIEWKPIKDCVRNSKAYAMRAAAAVLFSMRQSRHLRATRAVPAFYTLLLLDQLAQSSIPDLLSSVLFSQNGLTERSGCREQQKGVICRDAPHFSVWHASVCSPPFPCVRTRTSFMNDPRVSAAFAFALAFAFLL